jgi:hypothetical protein
MKRTVLVLIAGIASGALANVAWFAAHRPPQIQGLDAQLGWMQTSLHLSPAQFAQIKQLHAKSWPHMRELAAEVAHMRAEYTEYENMRKSTDDVDFVEFAQFVQRRRAIDRECLESTRRLVLASSAVMDAAQKARYLTLLSPALHLNGAGRLN